MNRIVAFVIDLVLVAVFTIIGRASHAESLSLLGVLKTAWPFLVATLLAWVVVRLLEDDGFGIRTGLVVWILTVLVGLGLRLLGGDTARVPFVIVTAATLAVFLLGWRLIAIPIRRSRARSA